MARSIQYGAAAAILLIAGCGKQVETTAESPPPTVVVSEVRSENVPIVFEVSGTVQGSQQVEIKPRVSGTMEKILLTEGSAVAAGDPLYQIDPRPFQAQLDAAKAQLAVDQANLEYWNTEVERYTKLVKKGAASVERKDDTIKNQKKSVAAIAKDQADIRQAELNLGYTRITAPFDGIVQATRVYPGAVVTAQQTTLTELVNLDPVYVVFNVSRSDAYKLQQLRDEGLGVPTLKGITTEYDLPDGSRSPIQGHMDFRSTQLDPATDTFAARAIFDNPGSNTDRDLIPGQYVPVYLTVGHRPDTLLIPQTALQQTQEGNIVWVVGADGRTERRTVTLGGAYGDEWIIKDGLKSGEQVISQGLQKVRKSGVAVKAVSEPGATASGAGATQGG